MIVHATPEQLADWTGTAAPANATALLRSASLLVDRETVTAVYATDTTGRATDDGVLAVLRDATCAQAATWAALGIDPTAGPAGATAAQVISKKIGTASIEYDRNSSGATLSGAARAEAVTTLTAEAAQILAAAGLLSGAVWVRG